MKSFTYGLRCSCSLASSLNKCFFVNSPWHCASFTKQNPLNNPLTGSGVQLKIHFPFVPYTGILLISVLRCRAVMAECWTCNPRLWVRISAPAGIVHDWAETLEQGTEPTAAPRAPQCRLPTDPGVCALGWVKCSEHISLLVILFIIVYVTNKNSSSSKMRVSGLNQMHQSECPFIPFVLLTDASAWKRVFTVSSVGKMATVIVISISIWCDATLTFIVKCQTLKRLNASGRGLWWEDDNLSMSCSGGSVYANIFLGWHHLALQIQNEPLFELD